MRAKSFMLTKCMQDKKERRMCMYELAAKQIKFVFLQRGVT
jgi:hypothetical protein